MEVNILTIIATLINFSLLIAITILLYKVVKGIKNFINRNKELDKKVDIILSKLGEKGNK
jgi:hypothetical protein